MIRASSLFETIETALKKNISGERLSGSIDQIYVRWSPSIELENGLYEVDILFLCSDEAADLRLNSLLETKLESFTKEGGHNGIKLVYANTVRSETFISQLDGYKRLSESDYLSNLGDVAESGH